MNTIRRAVGIRRWLFVCAGVVALAASACTAPPGTGTPGDGTPGGDTDPVAIARGNPSDGQAPLEVFFQASGSSFGSASGGTYWWDFGDGEYSVQPFILHTYTEPGVYEATLTVTTPSGVSATSAPVTITVEELPYFVNSTNGTDVPTCGDRSGPCRSINYAQTQAAAGGIDSIRVAAGDYHETVWLRPGMHISGGWTADFSQLDTSAATVVHAPQNSPAVIIANVADASISGLRAEGGAHTWGNAVGMLIRNSEHIVVGDTEGADTEIDGGTGAGATGILIDEASTDIALSGISVTSGASTGAGHSSYGINVLDGSIVSVGRSHVEACPGGAGGDSVGIHSVDSFVDVEPLTVIVENGCSGG